jgi:chromosome segregation ATPase
MSNDNDDPNGQYANLWGSDDDSDGDSDSDIVVDDLYEKVGIIGTRFNKVKEDKKKAVEELKTALEELERVKEELEEARVDVECARGGWTDAQGELKEALMRRKKLVASRTI